MNIGRELIRSVIEKKDIRPVLDAGLGKYWLDDKNAGSLAVFTGEDRKAYGYILDHWNKYRRVPEVKLFRQNFPEENLPFDDDPELELAELIDEAINAAHQSIIQSSMSDVVDLYDQGEIQKASDEIKSAAHRLTTTFTDEGSSSLLLGDPDVDIRAMMNEEMEPGIPIGVKYIDDEFFGMQDGHLVTMLGRQKSGKTTFIAKSVFDAWEGGYGSLFFSVEMDPEILMQRILCIGARVSPEKMRKGWLSSDEKDRVAKLNDRFTADRSDVPVRISKKRALITMDDIISEVHRYRPHIMYIDGFYFMRDRITGKTAGPDWQAHENLAAELKILAATEQMPILVSTQVQEKQHNKEAGIEERSMMGGTGLLRYSDLVIGLDRDKETTRHTMSCLLSRYSTFPDVSCFIDWTSMNFQFSVEEDK